MSSGFANQASRTTFEASQTQRILSFAQTIADPATTSPNNPYGNIIRIKFPVPQQFKQCELALANLYLFYSWYNIQASFGNNTFSYSFPTQSGDMTFNVTIPDGFYSITELNQYFAQVQLLNGTYLINTADSTPVFFLAWVVNSAYYRTTILATKIPGGGSGYTPPGNYPGGGVPTGDTTPSLIILPSNANAGTLTPGLYSFSKTLGILPGTYPLLGTNVSYSQNGQFAPYIESTSEVNVGCSIVNQGGLSQFVNIFATFSPQVPFGNQIVIEPNNLLFCPVIDGLYSYIDIGLSDENNIPLNNQDPHIFGVVIIRGH